MRLGQVGLVVFASALAACGRPQPQAPGNGAQPPVREPKRPVATVPVERAAPRQQPAIDPRSSEAAETIGQAFVDLVNRGRFDEAYMLLGPGAPPRADFDRQFAAYSHLRATMGSAGDQEGAAGSIYLTIPVRLSGRVDGREVDRTLNLVLRRVNDVPGSTEAQRHWHIERIEPRAP